MDYKSVLMITLTILVITVTMLSGMDSEVVEFPVSDTGNFTVGQNEWFDYGYWDEELSDVELVEDDDGYLVMDDPSRGDEAVWRSDSFSPDYNHEFISYLTNSSDVDLTGRYKRVNLQFFCTVEREVFYESYLGDGEVTSFFDEEVKRDNPYEIRLVFETDVAGESARVGGLEHVFLDRRTTGFSMDDLTGYVVFLLFVVLVGGFIAHEGDGGGGVVP